MTDLEQQARDIDARVRPFVDEYVLSTDGADYEPTEHERALIEDALQGFVAENWLAFRAAQPGEDQALSSLVCRMWERFNPNGEPEEGWSDADQDVMALLSWNQTLYNLARPSEDEQRARKLIHEAAALISPGEGEVVFYLRVAGNNTQLTTKSAKDVDPEYALTTAIKALQAELADAASCPIHSAKPRPDREAVAGWRFGGSPSANDNGSGCWAVTPDGITVSQHMLRERIRFAERVASMRFTRTEGGDPWESDETIVIREPNDLAESMLPLLRAFDAILSLLPTEPVQEMREGERPAISERELRVTAQHEDWREERERLRAALRAVQARGLPDRYASDAALIAQIDAALAAPQEQERG